jgi:hypothetical protein
MTDLREVLKPVTEAEFLRRLDNYTTRVADTLNGFGAENTEKRDQARRRVIEAFMSLHARLEMNDEFPAHDGIACRDATIKLQDERIAKLQSQSAMATGGQVKTAAPVCGTCHGRGYIGDDEANARNMESNPTCDVYLVKPCPDCKPAAQSEREAMPMVYRPATGKTIPDLTGRAHLCEWQSTLKTKPLMATLTDTQRLDAIQKLGGAYVLHWGGDNPWTCDPPPPDEGEDRDPIGQYEGANARAAIDDMIQRHPALKKEPPR